MAESTSADTEMTRNQATVNFTGTTADSTKESGLTAFSTGKAHTRRELVYRNTESGIKVSGKDGFESQAIINQLYNYKFHL